MTFLRVKNNFRLIYPIYHMMQTFRLNSKNKGEYMHGFRCSCHHRNLLTDSMESFVNDLTKKKTNRWLLRKEVINSRSQSQEEITSVEQQDLIDDIHRCLDEQNEIGLEKLIDLWEKKNTIILPYSVSCEALEFSAKLGNSQVFRKLLSHLQIYFSEFYSENSNYFEAVSLELEFKTKTNIDELLNKFEDLYKKSINDERSTKLIMRFCSVIIDNCVNQRGESAEVEKNVIKLKDKIERICENSRDYRLLFELWRRLFERYCHGD